MPLSISLSFRETDAWMWYYDFKLSCFISHFNLHTSIGLSGDCYLTIWMLFKLTLFNTTFSPLFKALKFSRKRLRALLRQTGRRSSKSRLPRKPFGHQRLAKSSQLDNGRAKEKGRERENERNDVRERGLDRRGESERERERERVGGRCLKGERRENTCWLFCCSLKREKEEWEGGDEEISLKRRTRSRGSGALCRNQLCLENKSLLDQNVTC